MKQTVKDDPIEPRPRAVPRPKPQQPKSGAPLAPTFTKGNTSPTPIKRRK